MSFFADSVKLSQSFVKLTGSIGIAGFVFDVAGESVVSLDSDITDHYVEDGTAVQDHIALKPEEVTLRGYVGEYVYRQSNDKNVLQKVTEKLVTLGSYLPAISSAASSAFAFAQTGSLSSLSDVGNASRDLFNAYKNINIPADKQSSAFLYFEALRNARQTFTIQTPYRYYTDMAIKTLKTIQAEDNKDQSNFEITFKRIRYVQTQVTTNAKKKQGRLDKMVSSVKNSGFVKGVEKKLDSVTSYF